MNDQIGCDVDFEWACEECGEKTHDNWMVSPKWADARCRSCRGYLVITDEEAEAIAMIQRGAEA
jgi:hypothetical protein